MKKMLNFQIYIYIKTIDGIHRTSYIADYTTTIYNLLIHISLDETLTPTFFLEQIITFSLKL